MASLWNSKHFPLYSHTMLIVGPEHAHTFAGDGWSAEDLKRHLYESVRQPYRTLLPDENHGEGTNLRFGATGSRPEPETMISKFPSTEEIHAVVAGGTAGRFSGRDSRMARNKKRFSPITRPVG